MAGDGEEGIDDLDRILIRNNESMTRDVRAVGARRVSSWRSVVRAWWKARVMCII